MLNTSPRYIAFSFLVGASFVVPIWVSNTSGADPAPKGTAPAEKKEVPKGPAKSIEIDGVHNAFQWTDKIVSGSCPYGDKAFKALADRGIKTIVTVDGALPDLPLAKKYGMRYVHIPVEYSGIVQEDALKIARAVRDLPGPIFIHCHHGIHRGPAAAAIAAIALGNYTNEEATAALKQAGTGANYKGLWALARDFKKPAKEELDKVDNTFPEAAKVDDMSAGMVNVDNRWDHLKSVQAAKWGVPADHPDIDPAHEALLLREAFREMMRSKEMGKYPANFKAMMEDSETASAALEAALRAKDTEKAAAAFDTIKANCSGCHKMFRDNK